MFAPAFVSRVNYKPIAPEKILAQFDPDKVLQMVRKEVLANIREKIMATSFSSRAKTVLSSGLKVRVGPNSVTLLATHPAFKPMIMGRKPKQMSWLTKATRPIPIVLDGGKVIFRTATAKSMRDGRWLHPGYASTGIVGLVKKEVRKAVAARLKDEFKRRIQSGKIK